MSLKHQRRLKMIFMLVGILFFTVPKIDIYGEERSILAEAETDKDVSIIEKDKVSEEDQKAIEAVIERMVYTLKQKKSRDYLNNFHTESFIYQQYRRDIKNVFIMLSQYDIKYKVESIEFIEETHQGVKVKVEISAKDTCYKYEDRKNTYEYIFRKEDEQWKIYDIAVQDIESLEQQQRSNRIFKMKRLYHKNGKMAYEGGMRDNQPDGKGTFYYENGKVMYEGEVNDGEMTGKGKLFHKDGSLAYEGQVKCGEPHKKGTAYYEKENPFYTGEWEEGKFQGEGIVYYKNGNIMYEGQWKDGKANGRGKGYYDNGVLAYEGQMKDNLSHGYGKEYYENSQLMYEGQWENGVFHGKGTQYDEKGNLLFTGQWEKGKQVQE